MNNVHLRMHATFGKIGIETRRAVLNIDQQNADLTIRQPKAEMHVERIPGKLEIDQTQAFAEANLKSVFAWSQEYAQKGHQAAMDGIARRAEEGDRLMEIENDGRPVADIARENSQSGPVSFNIGWMPKSPFSVKFHYMPSELNVRWDLSKPIIQAVSREPKFSYERGNVNIHMKQWPSLEIEAVGMNYDHHI